MTRFRSLVVFAVILLGGCFRSTDDSITAVRQSGQTQLFLNRRDGTFHERTREANLNGFFRRLEYGASRR